MYSETDISSAVEAGVLSPDAASALRNHVAGLRATPAVDEESFRLLTGFNDIFVSIALVLSLTALAWIGGASWAPLGPAAVALGAWGLAEYFTRQRRMALPSILLLLAFVGGVGGTAATLIATSAPDLPERVAAVAMAGVAALSAVAAWMHWRRFMVPITVAAGAVALVGLVTALVFAALPFSRDAVFPIVLLCGVGLFAFAMWWDMSDRARRTRRSDVAFWLHLAAAPMIAHPVFNMLGVFDSNIGLATAVLVVALYLVFGFVALAVDRRALLVSSLAYVLYALGSLFRSAGAVELSAAFTALVIGSALLMLSAFWQPMRRIVVGTLGAWRDRLPPVQQALAT